LLRGLRLRWYWCILESAAFEFLLNHVGIIGILFRWNCIWRCDRPLSFQKLSFFIAIIPAICGVFTVVITFLC
jgi:hypothetical protein